MKKLICTILAAITSLMVIGCQVDLSDYYTKEQADELFATKEELADTQKALQKSIDDVNAKFADYVTKDDLAKALEGYATTDDLNTVSGITEAVNNYLANVDFSEYIEDGYTNAEIDAKIKSVEDTISALNNTYETIANVNTLSDKLKSLTDRVETLESNKSNGITDTQIAQIKSDLQTWCKNNITGTTVDLTNYALKSDLDAYVKSTTLSDYAKTTAIPTDYVSTSSFNSKVTEIESRIDTIEDILDVENGVSSRLADLETSVSSKASSDDLTSLSGTVATLKTDYEATAKTVSEIDLSDYLLIATAESDYATKTSVTELTNNYTALASRVSTLETLTNGYDDLKTTVNNLSLAVNSLNADIYDTKDENGNVTAKGLKSTLAELKTTVADNYNTLIAKIGDSDSNISAIASRVSALETAKDNYKSYCDSAISGLASVYEKKSDLSTTLADYELKSEVADAVSSAIASNTTIVTKTYLESQNYLTSSSLSGYATTEALSTLSATVTTATENIASLQSAVATLESDKTKVEYGVQCYSSDSNYYYFNAYIKITDASGNLMYLNQQIKCTKNWFGGTTYNLVSNESVSNYCEGYAVYNDVVINGTWASGEYAKSGPRVVSTLPKSTNTSTAK